MPICAGPRRSRTGSSSSGGANRVTLALSQLAEPAPNGGEWKRAVVERVGRLGGPARAHGMARSGRSVQAVREMLMKAA